MADLAALACRACETPNACFVARPRPCDPGGGEHLAAEDIAIDPNALDELARLISEETPDRG